MSRRTSSFSVFSDASEFVRLELGDVGYVLDPGVARRCLLASIAVCLAGQRVRETEHVVRSNDLDIGGNVGPPQEGSLTNGKRPEVETGTLNAEDEFTSS